MSGIVVCAILTPTTTLGDQREAQRYFSNPINVLSVNQSPAAIKSALVYVSQEYGLYENQLTATVNCESSYHTEIYGPGKLAYGVSQFLKSTFDEWCKGSYYSPGDQIVCMAQMWQERQQYQWDCFKKLFN